MSESRLTTKNRSLFYVRKIETKMDTAEINYIVLHIETPHKSWWISMFCSISQFYFYGENKLQLTWTEHDARRSRAKKVFAFRHCSHNWCDDKRRFDNFINRQSEATKSIMESSTFRFYSFCDLDLWAFDGFHWRRDQVLLHFKQQSTFFFSLFVFSLLFTINC